MSVPSSQQKSLNITDEVFYGTKATAVTLSFHLNVERCIKEIECERQDSTSWWDDVGIKICVRTQYTTLAVGINRWRVYGTSHNVCNKSMRKFCVCVCVCISEVCYWHIPKDLTWSHLRFDFIEWKRLLNEWNFRCPNWCGVELRAGLCKMSIRHCTPGRRTIQL